MNIKIKITHYEKETPELKTLWKRLGLKAFDSFAFQHMMPAEGYYEIDTNHMFSNQYNTTCGLRIFEKSTRLSSPSMRPLNGYYISEGIDEIRDYQSRVFICHYCGEQYVDSHPDWCTKCRSSEYLEPSNYHLLKITGLHDDPAPSDTPTPCSVLEDIDKARYNRAVAHRDHVLRAAQKAVETAQIEADFIQACINNGIWEFDNYIFYDHSGEFVFGWRKPLSDDEWSFLESHIPAGYKVVLK